MIAKTRAIHMEPRPALPSGICSATSAVGADPFASGCVFSHSSDQQLSASRCKRVSSKPLGGNIAVERKLANAIEHCVVLNDEHFDVLVGYAGRGMGSPKIE
jgi:hypothetical protein